MSARSRHRISSTRNIFIELSNSTYTATFIAIFCLISLVRAFSSEEERELATYYTTYGKIPWKWEMEPFCQSDSTQGYTSETFWSAYLADVDVVLSQADCNVIQIESLKCVHRFDTGVIEWAGTSYVSFPSGLVFSFDLKSPRREVCHGFPVDTISDGRFLREDKREPITKRPFQGQPPLVATHMGTLGLNPQELLAHFHKASGEAIQWKWEMVTFCDSQSKMLISAYLSMTTIVLEDAECRAIEMETLNCEYQREERHWIKVLYVNGVGQDIFIVDRLWEDSKCHSDDTFNFAVLKREIIGGERRPITTRDKHGESIFQIAPSGGQNEVNSL